MYSKVYHADFKIAIFLIKIVTKLLVNDIITRTKFIFLRKRKWLFLNNAKELIIDKVESVLKERKFKKILSDDENKVIFSFEDKAYVLFFDVVNKKVELRLSSMNGSKLSDDFKIISTWLFDDETSKNDAEDIANDFLESLIGKSKLKSQKIEKSKSHDENDNVDSMFLINRFTTIFPELKNEVSKEKEEHSSFRYVTFTKENIVPLILLELEQESKPSKVKKITNLLNNLYKSGNLDVRSIVTIVILNSIESKKALDSISKNMSEELTKAMKEARKYKGKKVRPEKQNLSSKMLKKAQSK